MGGQICRVYRCLALMAVLWCWMAETAGAEMLSGIIEWRDNAPPPTVRVLVVPVLGEHPVYRKQVSLKRPFIFRLRDLQAGHYLLIVELRPDVLPLVRWVHLKDDAKPVRVRVWLNRTLLKKLRQRWEGYRGFMQVVHRSPLHMESYRPTVWAETTPHAIDNPVNIAVAYWMIFVPSSEWRSMPIMQATRWQWFWGATDRLRGSVVGQWIRGLWDRWQGAADLKWQIQDTARVHVRALYERFEPDAPTVQTLSHGWVNVRTVVRMGSRWQLRFDERGRVVFGRYLPGQWSYWSEVRLDYQDTEYTRLYVGIGAGRMQWFDLLPFHEYRQAYWLDRWMAQLTRVPDVRVQRFRSTVGIELEIGGNALRVDFRWQDDVWWQWNVRAVQYVSPGIGVHARLRAPLGEMRLAYALQRRLAPPVGVPFARAWQRQFLWVYTLREIPFGRLSLRYAYVNDPLAVLIWMPREFQALDLEWQSALRVPMFHSSVQLRLALLNLFNHAVHDPATIGPAAWILPRTWVWSIVTSW